MLDTMEKKYSPLIPEDMTDELFWKDGLAPNDERLWVPNGPGRWAQMGRWCNAQMVRCINGVCVPEISRSSRMLTMGL